MDMSKKHLPAVESFRNSLAIIGASQQRRRGVFGVINHESHRTQVNGDCISSQMAEGQI
jgi:hypothetical protein